MMEFLAKCHDRLSSAGVVMNCWHPFIKSCPGGEDMVVVSLDKSGKVEGLSVLSKKGSGEGASQKVQVSARTLFYVEKDNHNRFPCVKMEVCSGKDLESQLKRRLSYSSNLAVQLAGSGTAMGEVAKRAAMRIGDEAGLIGEIKENLSAMKGAGEETYKKMFSNGDKYIFNLYFSCNVDGVFVGDEQENDVVTKALEPLKMNKGVCMVSGDIAMLPECYPSVPVPVMGSVRLFSRNAQSPCLSRHGKKSTEVCPMGVNHYDNSSKSLKWLTDWSRRNVTWTSVGFKIKQLDRRALMIVCPTEVSMSQDVLDLLREMKAAEVIGGSDFGSDVDVERDPVFGTKNFMDSGTSLCEGLKKATAYEGDPSMEVAILEVVDKGNCEITHVSEIGVSALKDAVESWCSARDPGVFDVMERKYGRKIPSPWPGTVRWITGKTLQVKSGKVEIDEDKHERLNPADGLEFFISPTPRGVHQRVFRRMMQKAVPSISMAWSVEGKVDEAVVRFIHLTCLMVAIVMKKMKGKDYVMSESVCYKAGQLFAACDEMCEKYAKYHGHKSPRWGYRAYCVAMRSGVLEGFRFLAGKIESPYEEFALERNKNQWRAWRSLTEKKRLAGEIALMGIPKSRPSLEEVGELFCGFAAGADYEFKGKEEIEKEKGEGKEGAAVEDVGKSE